MSATIAPGLIFRAGKSFEVRFLLLAFRALEPIGRLMAHDVGDLAAQVKLADPIRVVVAAHLVARRLCSLALCQ